jgi:Beta-lactamase enzyme family
MVQASSAPDRDEARRPTAAQLHRAEAFATERDGRVSFAVVDTSGSLRCFRCRTVYHAASVVKAMLLVAYLNRLANDNEVVPADHDKYIDAMIRTSDNAAATTIYTHVGDERLEELAEQARMADFRVHGSWGSARITAADQARFFARIVALTAPEYQPYVRRLLSSIVPDQSWGIPRVARPEWRTFFKGGWLTHDRRGYLVHQVARLETRGTLLTVAVLTDGNPSDAYGRETIAGIANRLLGR